MPMTRVKSLFAILSRPKSPGLVLGPMASKKKLKRRVKELQRVVDALVERAASDIAKALIEADNTKRGTQWCVQCEGYCGLEEPC